MIGDSLSDVQAGQHAGCLTVWIANPRASIEATNLGPDCIASNLLDAASFILAQEAPNLSARAWPISGKRAA
jgi:phosphoglycolate phosphatase-like HAD superfamily hydrolase